MVSKYCSAEGGSPEVVREEESNSRKERFVSYEARAAEQTTRYSQSALYSFLAEAEDEEELRSSCLTLRSSSVFEEFRQQKPMKVDH